MGVRVGASISRGFGGTILPDDAYHKLQDNLTSQT